MSESDESFFYRKVMRRSGWIWLGSAFPAAIAVAPTTSGVEMLMVSLIGFAVAVFVARTEGHERGENAGVQHEAHSRENCASERSQAG